MYSTKANIRGLTLVELVEVIGVIAVLGALLLPALSFGNPMKNWLVCSHNQRQIALSFMMWKGDNNEKYPWQISTTNGGTMELSDRGYVAPNFNILSNCIGQPYIFLCRSDKVKTNASKRTPLNNQNISYFVELDAGTNNNVSILTGDRHLLANQETVRTGLFIYSNSLTMEWSRELHGKDYKTPLPIGVVSFLDGHTEVVRSANLTSVLKRQGANANRLAVP